ncbi:glycosyltransferase [Pinirhizobacter soli]|uniref:glycosyltransferase n=1 Tax=Pinirhizobacter soli TaxID=2786953 RepID=UPI002029F4C6|nr:glycosyltransferase [Pinirhizobacter soli]
MNPAIGMATVLESNGHEVAWVAHDAVRHLLGKQQVFPAGAMPALPAREADVRGIAALRQLWSECLAPLALGMDESMREAIARFSPDVMLIDQQAVGAALRAHEARIPWVTLASSPGELATRRDHPSIQQWTQDCVADVARRLDILSTPQDALFSRFGCVMPSCPALMGPVPQNLLVRDVGCLVRHRRSSTASIAPRQQGAHVLVTLGTVSHHATAKVLQAVLLAARGMGSRLHWTIIDPDGSLGESHLDQVRITKRVRQIDLLPGVDAVMCHGGHNTIAEAMLFGVPVVVAPIRDDQPYIAQRVVDAGAGLRIRFAHATAAHIADAVERITGESHFRQAAQVMGTELADGEARVWALLQAWLENPQRPLERPPSQAAQTVLVS